MSERRQLLTCAALAGTAEGLKHFTGLRKGAHDWLVEKLRLAVRFSRVIAVFAPATRLCSSVGSGVD